MYWWFRFLALLYWHQAVYKWGDEILLVRRDGWLVQYSSVNDYEAYVSIRRYDPAKYRVLDVVVLRDGFAAILIQHRHQEIEILDLDRGTTITVQIQSGGMSVQHLITDENGLMVAASAGNMYPVGEVGDLIKRVCKEKPPTTS